MSSLCCFRFKVPWCAFDNDTSIESKATQTFSLAILTSGGLTNHSPAYIASHRGRCSEILAKRRLCVVVNSRYLGVRSKTRRQSIHTKLETVLTTRGLANQSSSAVPYERQCTECDARCRLCEVLVSRCRDVCSTTIRQSAHVSLEGLLATGGDQSNTINKSVTPSTKRKWREMSSLYCYRFKVPWYAVIHDTPIDSHVSAEHFDNPSIEFAFSVKRFGSPSTDSNAREKSANATFRMNCYPLTGQLSQCLDFQSALQTRVSRLMYHGWSHTLVL